jgi:L-ascorbate metabolism protein UlaG (beta-lactamase superfamily)
VILKEFWNQNKGEDVIEIEYKGANTVVISTKGAKLVTDPKLSLVGLKDYAVKDAIELATEARFALNSPDATLAIEGPGEYEVFDFSIRGISAHRHIDAPDQADLATIYRIEADDVRIGLVGNITSKLDEEQLEALGVVDIVIVPVGGNGYTLDATSAVALVRAIDAKVVIPVHFADKALKYEVPQEDVAVFEKEFGGEVEQTPRYKIKSHASLPQSTTIIELSRS